MHYILKFKMHYIPPYVDQPDITIRIFDYNENSHKTQRIFFVQERIWQVRPNVGGEKTQPKLI